MASPLERAFEEVAKLPEHEQEAFAEFILAELKDEREWQRKFAETQDALAKLSAEARAEYRAGKTRPVR